MPRFRMTTRQGMVAVAFIALGLYWPELGVLAIVSFFSVVAARTLVEAPGWPRPRRRAVSYFVTLACLYVPYSWLLAEFPWGPYRWFWIKMWPVLPGLLAGVTFHQDAAVERCVMGLATVVLIALFTWLGGFGRAAMIASGAVALVASCFQSVLSYGLYLM